MPEPTLKIENARFILTLDPERRMIADGSYTEQVFSGGTVQPAFLPNVTIDLDALFEA